jgi:transposase
MRKGEIAAARPQWVNLEQGTITVPAIENDDSWSRKGMMGRKQGVSIELVGEISTYFHTHGIKSPYLLRPDQAWGKWKYRYDFSRKVRTHLKNCGFPDITIHDLRRSFGSNRIMAGRSLEQVAHWMGIHRDTAWKYYARFTPTTGEIEHGSAASTAPPPTKKKKKTKKKKPSPEDRLFKLKQLFDKNLITEDEYTNKRKAIIELI